MKCLLNNKKLDVNLKTKEGKTALEIGKLFTEDIYLIQIYYLKAAKSFF